MLLEPMKFATERVHETGKNLLAELEEKQFTIGEMEALCEIVSSAVRRQRSPLFREWDDRACALPFHFIAPPASTQENGGGE